MAQDNGVTPEEIGAEVYRPVPQQRISQKVDELMARRDYPAVERTLTYWLEEARAGRDLRGRLMIRNELVGHYRKTGEREKAHESADDALRLLRRTGLEGTLSAATTFINIGTAYNSFGENEEALTLFRQAASILENSPAATPSLLGGLCNNLGLTLTALGRYEEAMSRYEAALRHMENVEYGEAERAITCLNMADTAEAQMGAEAAEGRINELLEAAERLLDTPTLPRNGYYAYVCEHCAPTFAYYGWFAFAQELKERAEAIYERT